MDVDLIKEIEQEYHSSKTYNKNNKTLPRAYNMGTFKEGTFVVDVGAGIYDVAGEYLATKNVLWRAYDPYNRTDEYNKETIRIAKELGGADYVVSSNVLNAIKEFEVRQNILLNMKHFGKENALFYFTFYSGDSTGVPKQTSRGWQNNRTPTKWLPEVELVFDVIEKKKNFFVARNKIV